MHRRYLVAAMAALVTTLAAGCKPADTTDPQPSASASVPPSASPSPSPGSGTATTPPAAPLAWRACPELADEVFAGQGTPEQIREATKEISYECATLTVPQDWTAARGGRHADDATFSIALTRARWQKQNKRIGSLVINPGGPGGSGIDAAVGLALGLPDDVRGRFDIVGFDPRGVGRSNPVRCLTDAEIDASYAAERPDISTDAGFDAAVADMNRHVASCVERVGPTLRLFNTVQTARDLDAIRAALGERKLTYLGYSYGTEIGAVYAQLYPKRVRAMVLDGAVDMKLTPAQMYAEQNKGFDDAGEAFFAWCAEHADECPPGSDAEAKLDAALTKATSAPLTAADGRTVTPGWITTGVTAAMYSSDLWPVLGGAIADLGAGNPTAILALADGYAGRSPDGKYSNMGDAHLTISCNDDDTLRPTSTQLREMRRKLGPEATLAALRCAEWPRPRTPLPTGKAKGAPPILVVGTTGDPATPYAWTGRMAKMLGVGTTLTWQGEGHTAYPKTECVSAAVNRYLIEVKAPRNGTSCPAG